jgi:hypothetical protein
MTLKIYTKADDIPEGLRGEYKQSGAQWAPDLADDHPVLVLNKTLKQEKEVVEAKAKKLSNDLDDALEAAKTSGVPRGQALVAKADAEALNGYKALGTVDEVKAKVTEHGTLKESETKRQREDSLVLVAKELGYDNVEAFKRLPNLPDFDIRDGKDGKKQVIALVKDGDKVVEKPATEYLESSADVAPFLSALKTTTGVSVNTTSSTTAPKPNDPYAWATNFAKGYIEDSKPVGDPFKAFTERQSAI